MKNWYVIIKGREDWSWKSLIKGKYVAESKKDVRKIVEDEIGKGKIPMRISGKDVKPESVIIAIYELKDDGQWSFLNKMFEEAECKTCGIKYKPVDVFNIFGHTYQDFCSYDCKEKDRKLNFKYEDFNVAIPVVYKITQISTGKVYVGQTKRSFTLRWWEHVKSADDNKFHLELKNSDLEDWTFQVIEKIENIEDLNDRESYWIKHYNSIESGFNTMKVKNKLEG